MWHQLTGDRVTVRTSIVQAAAVRGHRGAEYSIDTVLEYPGIIAVSILIRYSSTRA